MSSDEDTDPEEREEVSNAHFIHAPLQTLAEHSNVVVAADWLTRGDQVVSASWDCSAIVFDAETGNAIDTLSG